MITLEHIDEVVSRGPYAADWESLTAHRTPEWFKDAKFGIFIHWGVYSVPAYNNEWYPRNMYIQGSPEFEHHVKTYGPHKDFGYKNFIPLFKAEHFSPEAWAALFKEAGAKYVVPVAEHHDGFQMYKSELSHWNAFEMGPHRDTTGELHAAVRADGMSAGVSSHRAEHWFFLSHGRQFDSDIREPIEYGDLYWPSMPEGNHQDRKSEPAPSKEYLDDWLLRTCELIENYHPRLLYFDWWIQHNAFKPYLKRLAAFYYNSAAVWGDEVVLCYKHDAFVFGSALVDIERGQCADVKPYAWQTDTAVALNSWCYTESGRQQLPDGSWQDVKGNRYRPAEDIVRDLVDIVSKNGNLLLNIGPKADGTIPGADAAILKSIGAWLADNGEAVYGTRPWRYFGEGPTKVADGYFTDAVPKEFTSEDFRYTQKGQTVYAVAMRPSGTGEYALTHFADSEAPGFNSNVLSVEMLGQNAPALSWDRDEKALHIRTAPGEGDMPVAFRIRVE